MGLRNRIVGHELTNFVQNGEGFRLKNRVSGLFRQTARNKRDNGCKLVQSSVVTFVNMRDRPMNGFALF